LGSASGLTISIRRQGCIMSDDGKFIVILVCAAVAIGVFAVWIVAAGMH
jgi:hypothetical protein